MGIRRLEPRESIDVDTIPVELPRNFAHDSVSEMLNSGLAMGDDVFVIADKPGTKKRESAKRDSLARTSSTISRIFKHTSVEKKWDLTPSSASGPTPMKRRYRKTLPGKGNNTRKSAGPAQNSGDEDPLLTGFGEFANISGY